MSINQFSNANINSAESTFNAVADLLPPLHKKCVMYSEADFLNTEDLKKKLEQDRLIIVSYTNFWLGIWDRWSQIFVDWTYFFFGSLLVTMLLGGIYKALTYSSVNTGIVLGVSVLAALVFSMRYSRPLPPMAEQSLTLIDGQSKELIHACRMFDDKAQNRFTLVPLSDLAIELLWGQIADHSPSYISIRLCKSASTEHTHQDWPGLCLGSVDHHFVAFPSEDVIKKAKDIAEILGAKYVGLVESPE